jgi:hypothetical protein
MLITVPGTAHGAAAPTSILDLEPLLTFVRGCRPDAVSLLPPCGADDLPNGAALLPIKNRLAEEGLKLAADTWEIPVGAPVLDPSWQMQQLFEARWLLAALGEAGIDLLPVNWAPPCPGVEERDARNRFLDGMLEEAERSEVRLALYGGGEGLAHSSGCLGACSGFPLTPTVLPLLAVDLSGAREALIGRPELLAQLAQALPPSFAGPLLVRGLSTPAEYEAAVSHLRAALGSVRGALLKV